MATSSVGVAQNVAENASQENSLIRGGAKTGATAPPLVAKGVVLGIIGVH
jgi:hypothetical protein